MLPYLQKCLQLLALVWLVQPCAGISPVLCLLIGAAAACRSWRSM